MKNKIIIFVLLIIVLTLVVFWWRQNHKAATPAALKNVPALTPPAFPTVSAPPLTYTVSLPVQTFPTGLPFYETGQPTVAYADRFSALAKTLGFTGEAAVMVISRGNFSAWNQGTASLTLGGDPLEISYNTGAGASGVISQQADSLEKTARAFIQKTGIVPESVVLSRESVDYFAPSGSLLNPQPGPSGATLIQINFRYLLDTRPLFTRQANMPSLSATFNSTGQVISLSGVWFPGLVKTSGSVNVLDYKTAVSRLTGNLGVLVSLSSAADFNSESSPDYTVSASSINEAVLGYYYSPGDQNLTPVFFFRGVGTDDITEKPVDTITLVSALP